MARYTGPVCRLCRREGEKLFLKGTRCLTPKCAFERRGYAPGQHGQTRQFRRRGRDSDYALQLREKQKVRRIYGVLEKQFRRYYQRALQVRGLTGQALLQILESRLDNVVFRLGFADSRAQARQLVLHGHFEVNDRRTNIPSMLMRPGDKIKIRAGSRKRVFFKDFLPDIAESHLAPTWLERDVDGIAGRILQLPTRSEIDTQVNEQLIVEFYSR